MPGLGLPLGRRAWSIAGPCQEGSLEVEGEADLAAGTAISLRGLPLGFAGFAASATAAASAAASAGVLHEHHASVIAAVVPDHKCHLSHQRLMTHMDDVWQDC